MKIVYILICMLLFSNFVYAGVFFSEVLHDYDVPGGGNHGDDAHEWIEVLNTGDAVVFDDNLYFEDATTAFWEGKCWKLEGVADSGEYAIITKNPTQFLIDFPGYTGHIIDSAHTFNFDDDHGVLRLWKILGEPYIGADGWGDCEGEIIDEIEYSTYGPGYSVEKCADGLYQGPYGGNPGYSDCAQIIPEFSSAGLIIALLGGVFVLFLVRR